MRIGCVPGALQVRGCRPTTLRGTLLACALTISLRFPLQESAAVASRCALRSLLTSERPHLVGQQICTGAYLWPRWSEAQTGPFLSGSTCGYSTTLPPRSRPLPKQPFNPPLIAAFSLLPPLSPISCSTHSTHGSPQDPQRRLPTIWRLISRTVLEQPLPTRVS